MRDPADIVFREIAYGSELYNRTKDFRETILRKPLGISLSAYDLKDEDRQFHFAAVRDDLDILGTVLLNPISAQRMKLRQMAVGPETEGMGIGRKLVTLAEEFARKNGYNVIEMIARCSAQGFYEKLGYHTVGDIFIEKAAPVPSIIMERTL